MFKIFDSQFTEFLKSKREEVYNNPDSCMKEYHNFLLSNGIYPSLHHDKIIKKLERRGDLCDDVLSFFHKAKLGNERLRFLYDLKNMGYNKNKLAELILDDLYSGNTSYDLWGCADLLYELKTYDYLPKYLELIQNRKLGNARQMLVLLVGKSKKEYVIPVLTELLDDPTVDGHALDALSNFSGSEIESIMEKYLNCDTDWIRKTAEKYLEKKKKKNKTLRQ